jgi:hypothetical protein
MTMNLTQSLYRTLFAGVLLTLTACNASTVTLTHVHGLAFSPDGQQLSIPSHHGLAVYSDGQWRKADGPEHDYMGFAVTRQAIYSSGHPAKGSGLPNPFGLIKSGDGGATWQPLALQGESDFHLLASGFDSGALYVYNGHPNSQMRSAGLYYSLNDGARWRRAAAQGVSEVPAAMAVHPVDKQQVALAGNSGLYLSTDAGKQFQAVVQGEQVLSAAFSLDGKSLWFGSYADTAKLSTLDLQTLQVSALGLPDLTEDAVAYLAQNPAKPQQWAIATFKRDVYLSQDAGKTWKALAQAGKTLD